MSTSDESLRQPSCDPGLLQTAIDQGAALNAKLSQGDVSPFPDEILSFLDAHSVAINVKYPVRERIAEAATTPPFTPEKAKEVGQDILNLMRISWSDGGWIVCRDEILDWLAVQRDEYKRASQQREAERVFRVRNDDSERHQRYLQAKRLK